ncbi:MAG TPA: sulfate ABC transporter substrate-binding protein [Acidimicrobiales bacterium]|nr:sulfate ABC transporter substrate-binding protein [Acidimicrobiales bacterium]
MDPALAHRARAPRRWALCLAGTLAAVVPLAASGPAGASGGSVALVAYSTPKPAYAALISAFAQTAAGQGVTFAQSYGPSGTQATAVANGLPADVVNFSLSPDMNKLVKAGLVSPSWAAGPNKGFVTNSIVSFVVRPGNPKHIKTWSDLVRSGVTVITPNPFSSGSAKWNLMAAYGAQLSQGKSKVAATAYLGQLLKHTAAQPTSASTALQAFLSGQGDVLLDYEDDALYAVHKGEPVQIVTPPQTILIQNPIAVSTKPVSPTAAKAFLAFLLSPKGQTIWGQQGYRPVLAPVAKQFHFPKPKTLFTIDSLGGWTKVNAVFFNPQTGVVAKLEQGLGVPTASS